MRAHETRFARDAHAVAMKRGGRVLSYLVPPMLAALGGIAPVLVLHQGRVHPALEILNAMPLSSAWHLFCLMCKLLPV